MSKSKKKYPRVACARCGKCCREPIVPITHKDLRKLMAATKKPASAIVRFCSEDEMEYDSGSGMWINFKSGRRAMVLKKSGDDRCMFQAADKSCVIYDARPMTCRTFPYSVYFEDDDFKRSKVDEIVLNKVMKCNAKKCDVVDTEAIVDNAVVENKNDLEYYRLIKKWNESDIKNKTFKEFLNFIGC